MKPNIVTYNTLIDACHRAGNLRLALDVLTKMIIAHVKPDVQTYTSLISTFAQRGSSEYGVNDPYMAFYLIDRMVIEDRVIPKEKTYCTLINVCGRYGRSDLALKGLRMMLQAQKLERVEQDYSVEEPQQKLLQQDDFHDDTLSSSEKQVINNNTEMPRTTIGISAVKTLSNNKHITTTEKLPSSSSAPSLSHPSSMSASFPSIFLSSSPFVGAWTATIDACGKSRRIGTALQPFQSMLSDKFNVKHNNITC